MSPSHSNNGRVDFPMNYSNMPLSQNGSAPAASLETDVAKLFEDLLLACRSGDEDTVDTLTLVPNLDINKVDEWDYSPLILASLCGHLPIVQMLLARGATCDRDTFQGARCIYGALTDEIRTLLLSYDITKKVDENQPFLAHISGLYTPLYAQLSAKDIAIEFPHATDRSSRVFVLNRFLMAARSTYFAKKLLPGGPWFGTSVVTMPPAADPESFRAIVNYLYLKTELLPLDMPPAQFLEFAKKLGLTQLLETIKVVPRGLQERARLKQQALIMFADAAREEMRAFMVNNIYANAREVQLEEEVSFEDIDAQSIIGDDVLAQLLDSSALPDAVMSSIDVNSGSVFYYPVHRAILTRSEYFATMFRSEMFQAAHEALPTVPILGNFGEKPIDRPQLELKHLPVLQASLSTTSRQVTELILQFLYYDTLVDIPPSLSVELLFAADELWMDRLKSMCALGITALVEKFDSACLDALPSLTGYSACDLVDVAWQTRCDRVEQYMTKLIAHNLSYICSSKVLRAELLALIKKSALRIRERQDTDTIELVDDMRYYLAKKHGVYDNFTNLDGIAQSFEPMFADETTTSRGFEHDIVLVDSLLEELALDA